MNYLEKAAELVQAEIKKNGPGIYHVRISHDSWCAMYHGGLCDCSPGVEVIETPPAWAALNN